MTHKNYFMVYDFETAGFDGKANPATQIALIIKDIDMNEVERFTAYIKPYGGLKIIQSALDFTKTTLEKLEREGVEVKVIYQKLSEIFKKYGTKYLPLTLVGHNADNFDFPFLETIFKLHGDDVSKYSGVTNASFCTMAFSRLKWGAIEVNDHKLGSVCERAGVSLTNAHEAMADTEATAEAFEFFVKCLRGTGGVNVSVKEKELVKFQF